MCWVVVMPRGEFPPHPQLSNVSLFLARINGCLEPFVIPSTLTEALVPAEEHQHHNNVTSICVSNVLWGGLLFLHSDTHRRPEIVSPGAETQLE